MQRETKLTQQIGPIRALRAFITLPAAGVVPVRAVGTNVVPFSAIRHLVNPRPLHRRGDPVAPRR